MIPTSDKGRKMMLIMIMITVNLFVIGTRIFKTVVEIEMKLVFSHGSDSNLRLCSCFLGGVQKGETSSAVTTARMPSVKSVCYATLDEKRCPPSCMRAKNGIAMSATQKHWWVWFRLVTQPWRVFITMAQKGLALTLTFLARRVRLAILRISWPLVTSPRGTSVWLR